MSRAAPVLFFLVIGDVDHTSLFGEVGGRIISLFLSSLMSSYLNNKIKLRLSCANVLSMLLYGNNTCKATLLLKGSMPFLTPVIAMDRLHIQEGRQFHCWLHNASWPHFQRVPSLSPANSAPRINFCRRMLGRRRICSF